MIGDIVSWGYVYRTLWLFLVLIGCWGAFLVSFGSYVAWRNQAWPEDLERVVTPLSSALTVLGLILTAMSVYSTAPPHDPYRLSKETVAPLVIVFAVAAFYVLLKRRSLPPVVVTGFSLMAISGGLLRAYPFIPA